MIPSRRLRGHRPSPPSHHQHISQIETGDSTPSSRSYGYVLSWLSQVHQAQNSGATPTSESDDEARDTEEPRRIKSSWYPNNLPVRSVAPNRSSRRNRINRFSDDDLIAASSATSRTNHNTSPLSDRSFDVRYTNCNRPKRRRSPSCGHQPPLPPRPLFEKKPRRKTRPDRYETRAGKRLVKEKPMSKSSKLRSRAAKSELRSSRDVVDNFASEAFSKKKLTMTPNLTTGLFFNGRSSKKSRKLTDLAFNEMSFLKVQEVAELHETDHAVNNEGNDEDENSEEFNRGEGFASDSTYEKAQVLETYRHSPLSNRTSNPSPLPESSVCQPGDKDKQAASEEVQPHHSNDHLLGERHTHLDRPPSDKEIETSVPQCDMPDIQEEVPIGTVSTRVIPQISVSTTQTTAATEPGGATGLPNEDPRIQQTNSEDQQTHNAEHISDKAPTMISPAHISAYKDQGVMVTPLLHQKQIYSENRWRDDLPREHQNMVYNIEPSKERLFHLHPQFGAKAEPRPEYSPMSLPSAHYEPPRWHDTFCSNKKENVQIGPYQRLRAFSAFNFPLEGTGIIRDRSHIGSTNVRSTSQLGDYREKASYEVTAGFKEKQLVGKERGDYSTGYGHQGVGTIDVDVIPLNRSHISPPSVSKRRPSLDGIDQAREILENYENEQFHAYGSNDETMIEFIDRVEAEALIEWNEAHFMEHTTDDNRGYDCDVNGGLNGTVEIGEDHEMTSFWWSNNPFV